MARDTTFPSLFLVNSLFHIFVSGLAENRSFAVTKRALCLGGVVSGSRGKRSGEAMELKQRKRQRGNEARRA